MRHRVFLAVVVCLLSFGPAERLLAQQRDSTLWLPPEVQGWISIPDLEQLSQSWDQTQFGRLLASEAFQRVIEAWRQQQEKQRMGVAGLEISWEEVRRIVGGEVALAVVHPPGREPSPVLLVDFRGHTDQASDLIRRFDARLRRQGVRRRVHQEDSPPLVQYTRHEKTTLVYFYYDDVLCLTKNLYVAQVVRQCMQDPQRSKLAADPVFQATVAGLFKQRRTEQAIHLRWFVRPLGLARAQRALDQGKLLGGGDVDWFEALSRTGFEQIRAAAGALTLAGTQYDVVHRIKIYAPRPWKGAVNVLALENHQHVLASPPPWFAGKLASITRLRLNIQKAFENFGPLFDEVVGEGAEGTWEDTLDALAHNEQGPKVDIRREIVAHLAHDCLLISAANKAQDHDRPRRVILVAIKDSPESRRSVASAIHRYMKPERTAKLRTDLVPGVEIWERLPEDPEDEGPEVDFGPIQVDLGEDERNVTLPAPTVKPSESEGICVHNGYVYYATHLSLLVELLKNQKAGKPESPPLAQSPAFVQLHKAAQAEATRQQWEDLCFFRFEDSAEQYRNTYQLARENKLAKSQNIVIRFLIGLGRVVDEEGNQLIDGKLLPPFEQVASQLTPGGVLVHADADGWSVVSFILHPQAMTAGKRPAEGEAPPKR